MSVVFHGSGFTFDALQIDDIETAFLLFACYRLIPGIMIGSVAFGLASSAAMLFFYAVLRGFYSPRDAVYRGVVVATGYAIFAVFWALTLKAVSDLLDGRAMTYLRLSDLPSLSGVSTVYIFSTEAILFGFATGLVLLVLIFISKSHAPRTIFTAAPIAAMVIMYAMAAVHLAIGINKEFFATFESFSAHHGYQYLIYNLTLAVNVLLSDAIVLWRACAVWMNHRYIVWPSILIFGLTIVSNTVNLVWDYEVIRPAELANIDSNIEFGLTFSSTIRGWVSMGASLLANIFATCAVGYKCWMHRRSIRRHLSLHRKRLITEKILSIFVESGVVFIGFWVAFIAIAFFDPSRSYGPLIYVNSMIQLITIYPTIMIALVFVEKQLDADDVIVSSSKLSGVQPPHNRVALTVSTMICTVPPREELAMERCGDYDVESGRLYHGAWKNEASGSVLDDGTGSTSKTAAVDVEKDSEVAAHRLLQS